MTGANIKHLHNGHSLFCADICDIMVWTNVEPTVLFKHKTDGFSKFIDRSTPA